MAADAPSAAIITLTTDFGLSDPYVAAMKGVILGLNPRAILVDITHEVRPQQILQATFVTQAALPYFPPGAIHAVVIDPGTTISSPRSSSTASSERATTIGP